MQSMDIEEQYEKVYRYCYLHTGHRQTAEDLTQETFLRFLENHSYQEMGKCLAYLYTIARNLCTDHYRKKKELPLSEADESPGEEEEQHMIHQFMLHQALKKLGREDQEMVLLRYVNEIPAGDIARIYGISRFAVYRRLKSSLKELKIWMGKEEQW